MNAKLEKIINLIKNGITDEVILKPAIFDYLSDDQNIIPNLMGLLDAERKNKRQLIEDMNLNLTRNTLCIINPDDKHIGNPEMRKFYLEKTKEFYIKHKDSIRSAGIKLFDDVD